MPVFLRAQKLTGSQLSLPHITNKLKITNTRTNENKKPMRRENQKQARESVGCSPVWYQHSTVGRICLA